MSDLIKQVLAQGDFGALQTSALLIFVGVMGFVTLWLFLPGAKIYYQDRAKEIGLEGGE
jgi:hypothetical protein